MKYAILMPNFGAGGDASFLVDLAREAEGAGWDAFFLWDHLQWPGIEPCVDPWVALGAMAVVMQRIRVGTMVTPVPRRDIAKLARETISVDRLSGGRLILGIGLGWHTIPEWSGFGHETELKTRGAMLNEALEVLFALWSGEAVDHSGRFYEVHCDGFGPPLQKPRISVWAGATWPSVRPLRRAAMLDGVMPIAKNASQGQRLTPEDVGEIRTLMTGHTNLPQDYAFAIGDATQGPNDTEMPRSFASAGVNWWVESCRSLLQEPDKLVERVKCGPARI